MLIPCGTRRFSIVKRYAWAVEKRLSAAATSRIQRAGGVHSLGISPTIEWPDGPRQASVRCADATSMGFRPGHMGVRHARLAVRPAWKVFRPFRAEGVCG